MPYHRQGRRLRCAAATGGSLQGALRRGTVGVRQRGDTGTALCEGSPVGAYLGQGADSLHDGCCHRRTARALSVRVPSRARIVACATLRRRGPCGRRRRESCWRVASCAARPGRLISVAAGIAQATTLAKNGDTGQTFAEIPLAWGGAGCTLGGSAFGLRGVDESASGGVRS